MSRKFRIGTDVSVAWTLEDREGSAYDLTGRSINVYLFCRGLQIPIQSPAVSANTISFTFRGKDQTVFGQYGLLYVENDGQVGMVSFDIPDAFQLTPHTWLTRPACPPKGVETGSVEITSRMPLKIPA
jgi:hypothetical protein